MSVTEWVGSTPPSWPLARIKYLCRTAGGGTPDKGKPEYWQGDIPWVSPKDMKSDRITDTEDHITTEGLSNGATQMVPPNSVLLVMRSGILRHSIPVAINQVPVSLNQDMRAFLPDERLAPRYLARLIEGHQAELLQAWSKVGATVESLESDLIGDTLIPLPPRHEQEAITSFLDRETSRLDALVAAKQRVLDLLAEKRKAVIATAVTRGLHPKVKLRDSGVPWLGAIPAHWETLRVRHLGSLKGGAGFPHEHQGRDEGEIPFFKVKDLGATEAPMLATDNYVSRETAAVLRAHAFPPGTIVFAKVGAALLLNRFRLLGVSGCIDNNMMGLSLDQERISVGFALSALSLIDFNLVANPGAVPSVNEGQVSEYRLPVPPCDEQRAIVEHIARETAKLDAVRAATERTIALLKERRSALIAAAVTGQLDVGAAA